MRYQEYIETPIGCLAIHASELGVSQVAFVESAGVNVAGNIYSSTCKQQLKEYFDGERKEFDVPMDFSGTDFQKSVWQSLTKIPFGQSSSYGEIATKINKPKAYRAVGTANSLNSLAIIVPCHRVIGSNNKLTGYAWGLDRKSWLLRHEGIQFN